MEENTISDIASEKLRGQMDAVNQDKSLKGFEATMIKYLCGPIGNMLIKFCYQDEEFARAIERFDKPLIDLLKDIAKMSTREKPGVSDVEAYAKAVKFYLPAAEQCHHTRCFWNGGPLIWECFAIKCLRPGLNAAATNSRSV